MENIGFCGLGAMGLPMAINLIKKSDKPVFAYDILKDKEDKIVEAGGFFLNDIEELYKKCDLIFLCLPTDKLVKDSIKKIIEISRPETIVVDLSSSSPNMIRELYNSAKEKKISLIDSPVSGGESGAVSASLVLMCGGDLEVFKQIKDILLYFGKKVTYIGPYGSGHVVKIINNMIVGCNLGAIAEGFALGAKAGLDGQILFEAIKDGFAGSQALTTKVPKILARDFSPSGRIAVHQKDLDHAKELARELGVEIPLSQRILNMMDEMEEMGKENEDHCAIVKIYEKNMGVEIK